jgi:CDGSH-type Zn-finger protein
MSNRVVVKLNGPLVFYGNIRIESENGDAIEESDNVFLCRCGKSKDKPFCDGEHKRCGFAADPHFTDDKAEQLEGDGQLVITLKPNAMLIAKGPMQIESEDGQSKTTRNKAAFCRCGQSKNKPFCDASHKTCGFKAD